jgi:antitoxin component of MazEF toxin-antitoxin module
MTAQVQITKIGDCLMIPLPDDILQKLEVKAGEMMRDEVEQFFADNVTINS